MDYNSFLKRDYKSLMDLPSRRSRLTFSRLHVILAVAAVLVVGTLLSLASHDAEATRAEVPTVLETGVATVNPYNSGRLIVPLAVPGLPNLPGPTTDIPDQSAAPEQPENWQEAKIRAATALRFEVSAFGLLADAISLALCCNEQAANGHKRT